MRDFLKNFPTETVRIVDENENEIVTVEGLFSDKGMRTTNVSTPIYEGQLIIRTLPNGLNEKYKIINSKYVKGMHDICDSYMLTLQKENVPKEKNITRSTITNNIYNCDKVNIDSIDNSVNIYINDNENEKINEIRNIITNLEGNSKDMLVKFDDFCNNVGKKKCIAKVSKFYRCCSFTYDSISTIYSIFNIFISKIEIKKGVDPNE